MKFLIILFMVFMSFSISFASEEDLKVGNRKFSVKLLQELLKTKPNQNLIFSPITIQILTSLLITGTKYETPAVKEIVKAMEFPLTREARQKAFKDLIKDYKQKDDDFKFVDANKIYFSLDSKVKDWFKTTASDVYKADAEVIDFKNTNVAAEEINKWAAKWTNNEIKNLLSPADLSDQTKILMISSLYLLGKWEKRFFESDTTDDVFTTSAISKLVKMMTSKQKSYEYFDNDKFQFLKLGIFRKDGDAAMVIVLPKCDGCNPAESNISDVLAKHPFYSAVLETASLPKFKFQNDLQLKPVLQNLGVRTIFTSSIFEAFNVAGRISHTVTEFSQKTLIEVNELGVSAVSETKFEVAVDTPNIYKTFIADHPFFFYITVSNVIVFAGYVVDP